MQSANPRLVLLRKGEEEGDDKEGNRRIERVNEEEEEDGKQENRRVEEWESEEEEKDDKEIHSWRVE